MRPASHRSQGSKVSYSKNLLSIARAVVRKAPGIDPLTGGPLHVEVFLKPLVKVRHVGRTVEDRNFLLTRRQLLVENLHARFVAILHEQLVDRPSEDYIPAGVFDPLELGRVQEVVQADVRSL